MRDIPLLPALGRTKCKFRSVSPARHPPRDFKMKTFLQLNMFLLKYCFFFLELADSYRTINNDHLPPQGKKSGIFCPDLIFPKNFRLRRAGSYFRLNFNTVFAFKGPKIFRLRRANFRRGLIFLRVSEKKISGVLSWGGGYC